MVVVSGRVITRASISLFAGSLLFALASCPDPTAGNPPTAAFWFDPGGGKAVITVNFTHQSTGAGCFRHWDFGDGSAPSTQQDPQHTYTQAGRYDVTLTVNGACGSAQLKKEDCVVAYGIAFSADSTHVLRNSNVSFTDLSVCPTGQEYTSWSWNFGDGTANSTEQNPTHSYANYGFFDVILTVGGTYKPGSSTPLTINVNPIADFHGPRGPQARVLLGLRGRSHSHGSESQPQIRIRGQLSGHPGSGYC